MLQNFFDDISPEDGYVITEPVTLAEAKRQLIVTHNEDDDYITDLISECRAVLENYCYISLVDKVITVTLRVENNISTRYSSAYVSPGDSDNVIELPYGPVKDITSVTLITSSGNITALTQNDDFLITGALYKNINLNSSGTYLLVYGAGYRTAIPRDLKLAILNEIAFRYENRGDERKRYNSDEPGICAASQAMAQKYRRVAWH